MAKAKFLFREFIEIPDDWSIKKLIELCKEKPQYGANEAALEKDERLPRYIRITDIDDDGELKDEVVSITDENSKLYILKEGDILFARTGSVGRTYLYKRKDGRCAFAGYLIKFIPDQTKLNLDYLFHYTHSFNYFRWLISETTQGVQSNVNAEQYSKLPIILPCKIEEQNKIASILSNISELIKKQQQVIEQTQKLKKGQTQKLFTKGLDHTELKNVPWIFQQEIKIPKEWDLKKANDVCNEIVVGIVIEPAKLYVEKGIPCFRSFNIQEDHINENDLVFISKESNDKNSKSQLMDGDVLIVRTGYPGVSCVTPKKFVGGNCIDIIIARPKKCLNSEFLSRFMNTFLGKQQITRVTGGSAQQHFNITEMKKLLIPIPSLPEQKKIVSILSNLDLLIQQEKQYKEKLQKIKRGLMQQFLTGKTRVKV